MISMWDMSFSDVVFTHSDTEGVVRHFAVSRLLERYGQEEMVIIPMDYEFARHVVQNNGLEPHRYARITHEIVLRNPVLYVEVQRPGKPVTHILIDGSHRYAWAAANGWKELPAIVLKPEQWEPFLIDVPEDITELAMRDIRNGTAKSYLP